MRRNFQSVPREKAERRLKRTRKRAEKATESKSEDNVKSAKIGIKGGGCEREEERK